MANNTDRSRGNRVAMNTRKAIQPSTTPAVISIAVSTSKSRFVTGLSDGICVFRTDNCLSTYKPTLPKEGGISIAEALDDRYIVFVPRRKISHTYNPHVAVIWDAVLNTELNRFNLNEPVLGVRLSRKWMIVVLSTRTVLFQYQEIRVDSSASKSHENSGPAKSATATNDVCVPAPNAVHSLYHTSQNDYALGYLSDTLLVLPAQRTGQVQLVSLKPGSTSTKRVLRAHNSALRAFVVSDDGSLIATASEQGTLIRVYDVATLNQVAEFRRGVDHAIIHRLAFSPGNRWVAATSDKGTLHIFDLQPPNAEELASARDRETRDKQHRKSQSYASHRLSGTGFDKESLSGISGGRSSPSPSTAIGTAMGTGYHGSVQEYYGLRPPPSTATPPARDAAVSVMQALKSSPLAPKVFRDIRSTASAPFYVGDDAQHWQGGLPHTWTTAPDGTKKRIHNPILPLPNDPKGRPPKGILTFAASSPGSTDDDGAIIYVIGGGGDARWEMFELLPMTSSEGVAVGSWALRNKGFRKYLTRQFTD